MCIRYDLPAHPHPTPSRNKVILIIASHKLFVFLSASVIKLHVLWLLLRSCFLFHFGGCWTRSRRRCNGLIVKIVLRRITVKEILLLEKISSGTRNYKLLGSFAVIKQMTRHRCWCRRRIFYWTFLVLLLALKTRFGFTYTALKNEPRLNKMSG